MTISQIRSYLEDIEKNNALFDEKNFDRRAEVIDFLEFHIIGEAETLMEKSKPGDWILLILRAEKAKAELEQIDDMLFKKLRANIRARNCIGKAFKDRISEYFDLHSEPADEPGYDNLDLFINRLFPFDIPAQTKDLEPEMVYYQKTPARIIFELAEKCHFRQDDAFFDIGSGLGQVAILVNLLTAVTTKGIEFEPA